MSYVYFSINSRRSVPKELLPEFRGYELNFLENDNIAVVIQAGKGAPQKVQEAVTEHWPTASNPIVVATYPGEGILSKLKIRRNAFEVTPPKYFQNFQEYMSGMATFIRPGKAYEVEDFVLSEDDVKVIQSGAVQIKRWPTQSASAFGVSHGEFHIPRKDGGIIKVTLGFNKYGDMTEAQVTHEWLFQKGIKGPVSHPKVR